MRALLFILPIALAWFGGMFYGQLGKKRAIAKQYALTQPVMRQMRTFLHTDPLLQPKEHQLQMTVMHDALEAYELQLRQL